MTPDIVVDLPAGWRWVERSGSAGPRSAAEGRRGEAIESEPDQPLCASPASDDGVLQLSSPSWATKLRQVGKLAELEPLVKQLVEGGQLGRLAGIEHVDLPYGRALAARIDSDEHGDVAAWLIVPAVHDVVFATWIADRTPAGAVARQIVARLGAGLLSNAIAAAVRIAGDALRAGQLVPHAVLFGEGMVTRVSLDQLPHAIWTDACRHERARQGAEVVVLVDITVRSGGGDVALIYGESRARARRLVVGDGPQPTELPAGDRLDFFAEADPRVAAALDAAVVTSS